MYYFMQIVNVFVWRWAVPCSSQNKIYVKKKKKKKKKCYVMIISKTVSKLLFNKSFGPSVEA